MTFDNILFDLDGTLTDSAHGITMSVQHALRKFGIDVPDLNALKVFVGPPLEESFEKYYGFGSDVYPQLLAAFREYYIGGGMLDNAVYPGITELLQALNGAGKNCYVATTKPEQPTRLILEHFGLAGYFRDVACGCDDSGKGGDKAKIIARILERNNITDRKSVVMIGDRSHDGVGAGRNGVFFCGVLYGYGSEEELKNAGAGYIAESTAGLADFLLGSRS
jgi:phosphoglycolate phosphatase